MLRRSKRKCKKKERKVDEDSSLLKLTKKICEIIHKESKKFIEKWLFTRLEDTLDKLVCEYVETEFKKDILPILLRNLDAKINARMSEVHASITSISRKIIRQEKRRIIESIKLLLSEEEAG